jgi:hypothetical protein
MRHRRSKNKKLVVGAVVSILVVALFLGAVVVIDFLGPFGSVTDSSGKVHVMRSSADSSGVLNDAALLGGSILVKGSLTCYNTVILSVGGSVLSSDGSGILNFNGCDGIKIKNSDISVLNLKIEQSYDLRTHIGISINGYASSILGYETLNNLRVWVCCW